MAHFAQLDENNTVLEVIVVNNDVIIDDNGVEQEQLGIDFLKSLYGEDTNWVQTSYNNNFRKQHAGIDCTYDPTNEVFIKPKPYPSWILDDNFDWQAPVPIPENLNKEEGEYVIWDEDTLSWITRYGPTTRPPEHDPETQYPYWNEETRSWEIKTIPQ